ncbi:MAG: alpha/beta fold hydrolase [Dehalococcoidia bacterium]
MRFWLTLAAALCGVVAGLVAWMGWRWVTPHREPDPDLPPGLHGEYVRFRSLDGTLLRGLWLPGRKTHPTIVLCHGYFRSLYEPLDVAVALHEAGYNVLTFDFRGCGRSGGRFTTLGRKEAWDVAAAVRYARERQPRGRVGVLGISMGASAAIIAAAHTEDIRALVADSPYSRMEGVMRKKLPDFLPAWAVPFGWAAIAAGEAMAGGGLRGVRPVDYIGRLAPRPLLLIYGQYDSYIPEDQPRELFQAAGDPREMWTAPGSDHAVARIDYPTEYHRLVLEFFDAHLRPARKAAAGSAATSG